MVETAPHPGMVAANCSEHGKVSGLMFTGEGVGNCSSASGSMRGQHRVVLNEMGGGGSMHGQHPAI